MRQKTESNVLSTLGKGDSYHIDKGAEVHIMRILRDMYSNPLMAVVREYLANAADAHAMTGTTEPIKVSLPSITSGSLIIRDFGPGLDYDEYRRCFLGYGATGKEKYNSSNMIGGFGIGCKSFFSISDTAKVTSWKNGIKRVWVCQPDNTDKGTSVKLLEEKSDEPSGMEVNIPIDRKDRANIINYIKGIAFLFDTPIMVEGVLVPRLNVNESYRTFKSTGGTRFSIIKEIMDKSSSIKPTEIYRETILNSMFIYINGIKYGLSQSLVTDIESKLSQKSKSLFRTLVSSSTLMQRDNTTDHEEPNILSQLTYTKMPWLILEVEEGKVEIAPNRETLIENNKTKNFIVSEIVSLMEKVFSEWESIFDSPDKYEYLKAFEKAQVLGIIDGVSINKLTDKYPLSDKTPMTYGGISAKDINKHKINLVALAEKKSYYTDNNLNSLYANSRLYSLSDPTFHGNDEFLRKSRCFNLGVKTYMYSEGVNIPSSFFKTGEKNSTLVLDEDRNIAANELIFIIVKGHNKYKKTVRDEFTKELHDFYRGYRNDVFGREFNRAPLFALVAYDPPKKFIDKLKRTFNDRIHFHTITAEKKKRVISRSKDNKGNKTTSKTEENSSIIRLPSYVRYLSYNFMRGVMIDSTPFDYRSFYGQSSVWDKAANIPHDTNKTMYYFLTEKSAPIASLDQVRKLSNINGSGKNIRSYINTRIESTMDLHHILSMCRVRRPDIPAESLETIYGWPVSKKSTIPKNAVNIIDVYIDALLDVKDPYKDTSHISPFALSLLTPLVMTNRNHLKTDITSDIVNGKNSKLNFNIAMAPLMHIVWGQVSYVRRALPKDNYFRKFCETVWDIVGYKKGTKSKELIDLVYDINQESNKNVYKVMGGIDAEVDKFQQQMINCCHLIAVSKKDMEALNSKVWDRHMVDLPVLFGEILPKTNYNKLVKMADNIRRKYPMLLTSLISRVKTYKDIEDRLYTSPTERYLKIADKAKETVITSVEEDMKYILDVDKLN